MGENWLQKTIDTPKVARELVEHFGKDVIDQVCSGQRYREAQATMANALAQALMQSGLTTRKQRRIGPKMIDMILNGCAIAFVLGYARAKEEAE